MASRGAACTWAAVWFTCSESFLAPHLNFFESCTKRLDVWLMSAYQRIAHRHVPYHQIVVHTLLSQGTCAGGRWLACTEASMTRRSVGVWTGVLLTVELLPPVEHLLDVLLHDAADVRQVVVQLQAPTRRCSETETKTETKLVGSCMTTDPRL